jgi:hypothetical protein
VEAAGGLSVKNIGLRLPVAFAALVLLLGGWARADIVTLTNGKTLEGRVTEDGDKVIVELPQGRVKLNKSQVKSITPKVTPQDEHAARSAEIEKAAKDGKLDALAEADKWFELAVWDGQQQLTNARADALNRALALSPAHAGAREMAGFVLHDGQWITRDERNQALGLTKVDGKWVSKEGAADLARIRNDARREELQQLKARTEGSLQQYVDLAKGLGLPATYRTSVGTDVVEEAHTLCLGAAKNFPRITFFAGQLVFQHETWYTALLHNQTAFVLQKRLLWDGQTMVVLPVRVR